MEKEDNYSGNFTGLDYFSKPTIGETSTENNNLDHQLHHSASMDRLSFADVMQFADFGPKTGIVDPVYFLKFPVLNDKLENRDQDPTVPCENPVFGDEEQLFRKYPEEGDGENLREESREINNIASVQQIQFLGENFRAGNESKNKRKRPRSVKTSEEVESQRMTHIAVERNRRKQMNEHLRVLRSLMPGSYVQRGDQASIIGGAIEFVRELEQLLQCLESQKRRRLYGDNPRPNTDSNNTPAIMQQSQPPPFIFSDNPMPISNEMMKLNNVDFETGLGREETAEIKSCLADVEVKLLGFDAIIKILCRRSPGQLIKTIAALEDLQFNILHTNITTIDQTVLYSFNVKVSNESRFNAEDIASAVQQIFAYIHANSI